MAKPKQDGANIHLVLEQSLAAALDEWRVRTRNLGTRQDAIRKILLRELTRTTKSRSAA